jgi:hypothetical protein
MVECGFVCVHLKISIAALSLFVWRVRMVRTNTAREVVRTMYYRAMVFKMKEIFLNRGNTPHAT